MQSKILPFINEEIVDEKAHIEEFCFLGLRMAKGIDKEIFKQKFNTDIENLYGEILPNLEKEWVDNQYSKVYLFNLQRHEIWQSSI